MIELKNLHVKNFLSHSDSNLPLSELEGLVLIEGLNSDGRYDSNGSGKSTLLEGIVYAVSGNTLRNVSVNDIVNRNSGKNTMCHLTLLKDGIPFDIYRYRKDEVMGDSLKVESNGKDISARLNKDTQVLIDTTLGIPYRVLTNTILLGEGLSSRFTQLSDSDKKSLIESTLSLSYDLGKAKDVVNSKLKDIKLEISRLSGSISTLENLLDSSKDTKSEEEYKKELNEVRTLQEELTSKVAESSQNLEVLENKLSVLSSAKVELEGLLYQINDVRQIDNVLQSKLETLDSESPHCELCGQSLSSEDSKSVVRERYMQERMENSDRLADLNKKLTNYPPLESITSHIEILSADKATSQCTNMELQNRLTDVVKDIYMLESQIKHIQSLEENFSKYKDQLSQELSEKSNLEASTKDYEYLSKLFSPTGIINFILEEAVGYINERLSVYTSLLIDKAYQLGLSKGKLTLEDSTGASYQSLSNGEKRRLDICIQFSLHDYIHNYCGIKLDTLFIDEVLDTLDSTGTENIIDVMRLKMEYCNLKRILVITHNQDLKSRFDTVLTVSKDERGNSKLI